MPDRIAISIDLGGTFIKGGAVDERGKIIHQLRVETGASEGLEAVIWRIETVVDSVIKHLGAATGDIVGVAIGCPGLTNVETGTVHFAPNLPGWENVELGARLAEKFAMPIVIENDANAAAWGEYWIGSGKGASSLVLVTLGTGIGGGIVLNGELWHGFTNTAGEFGHMIVEADGEPCVCGNRGCLEAYSSVTGLRRRATQAISDGEQSALAIYLNNHDLSGEQVYTCALSGDPLAARLMRDAGYYLGVATVSLIHMLNPEKVLFAGGLAAASDMIMNPIREVVQTRSLPLPRAKALVALASLGDKAGLIGAAGCVFHKYATSA